MTQRWTFYDSVATDSATMPINPDSMTSPEIPAKNVRFGGGKQTDHNSGGRTVTFLNKPPSRDWEFSGAIRTEAHYNLLRDWAAKPNEVTITDHLGRAWLVFITDFIPTDRKPTPSVPWRLRYVMKVKIIERLL